VEKADQAKTEGGGQGKGAERHSEKEMKGKRGQRKGHLIFIGGDGPKGSEAGDRR